MNNFSQPASPRRFGLRLDVLLPGRDPGAHPTRAMLCIVPTLHRAENGQRACDAAPLSDTGFGHFRPGVSPEPADIRKPIVIGLGVVEFRPGW